MGQKEPRRKGSRIRNTKANKYLLKSSTKNKLSDMDYSSPRNAKAACTLYNHYLVTCHRDIICCSAHDMFRFLEIPNVIQSKYSISVTMSEAGNVTKLLTFSIAYFIYIHYGIDRSYIIQREQLHYCIPHSFSHVNYYTPLFPITLKNNCDRNIISSILALWYNCCVFADVAYRILINGTAFG